MMIKFNESIESKYKKEGSMETKKHYIACTVIIEDSDGKIKFLVQRENNKYSFPATLTTTKRTALACVINQVKDLLNINVEHLELLELTNAVVHENRIPLYVFQYQQLKDEKLIQNTDRFTWAPYSELKSTFNEWDIVGVPLLSIEPESTQLETISQEG